MKGAPITNVKQIVELAAKKKSVWHEKWKRTVPAAMLENMPVRLIVGFIRMGWLYKYDKKK